MRIDGSLPITTIKQELPNCTKLDETVKEPADSVILSSNVEYSKIGQLLAKTTFDSGVNVDTAPEQRKIQREGLASIVSNTSTTEDEKTLSTLGITMGDHHMYDVSAARARNVILSAIKNGIEGSIGSVIAKVTYDAGVKMEDAQEQRALQRQGFEAIIANPDTTEEQKLLAKQGIEVGNNDMYDSSAAKARNVILQAIIDGK